MRNFIIISLLLFYFKTIRAQNELFICTSLLQATSTASSFDKESNKTFPLFININTEYLFTDLNISIGLRYFHKEKIANTISSKKFKFLEESDDIYTSNYIGIFTNFYLNDYRYISVEPFYRYNNSGLYTQTYKSKVSYTDDDYDYNTYDLKTRVHVAGIKLYSGAKFILFRTNNIDLFIEMLIGISIRKKWKFKTEYSYLHTSDTQLPYGYSSTWSETYKTPKESVNTSVWLSPQFDLRMGVLLHH